MNAYDWIVVGGGLAGSALGYELAQVGFSVLLLEQSPTPENATRYSYGGIAYWAGTTDLTRQLCQESFDRHRQLSAELDADTEFRELDLLLTIAPHRDPVAVAATYQAIAHPPTLLSPETACDLEPLLNPTAIAAALHLRHGHVSSQAVVQAYTQAFMRAGGRVEWATVTGLSTGQVKTATDTYTADNVAICAGALGRSLLRAAGFPVRLYFTQAELIETAPVDLRLRSLIMPAELQRFALEGEAGRAETDEVWDNPGHEVLPPILDVGAVQLRDGRLRLGQMSRTLTDPFAPVDAVASEQAIRQGIGAVLPTLQAIPGQWHRCLVSFSGDRLPLIGALPNGDRLHIFAGFSNPFALLPPLARRFAHQATGHPDPLLAPFSPCRFHSERNSS